MQGCETTVFTGRFTTCHVLVVISDVIQYQPQCTAHTEKANDCIIHEEFGDL